MSHPIAARTNPQAARSYWTTSRDESGRAFRAARRHSRWVRFLRVAIPATVVLGSTAITLITYYNPLRLLAKLPIGNVVINGTKITMEAPRMSGFTRDGRAYVFNADAAAQDVTKPDTLELQNISGNIAMKDNSKVDITADGGVYDTKKEILKLQDNILVNSSTGYQARLSEATVDTKLGNVVSEHPVEVKLLQGMLNSNRLEITDNGELVRFDGGVDMVLIRESTAAPAANAPAAAPSAAAPAPKAVASVPKAAAPTPKVAAPTPKAGSQ
jgi:lipopolysaccharide export system protein LptC